ncbi:hypothetical protein JD844_010081 [Phrynosoma platyrhinos]|uniref:Exoribonuclease phosphorolytic domain-containing protein n=1 Tax=Phrynosoma platyrhinos TaxID=52577 RepID=A0ABQ7TGP4_PHRPL|nr:hypothetical protein JD844_010081 [Phrynosoma platyrhinos]
MSDAHFKAEAETKCELVGETSYARNVVMPDSETIRLPYEEGELLEYLDAEELPPILVDLLEKSQEVKDDYVFECEVGSQLQKTKLTIFQSLGNPLYYGKIQMIKNEEDNESPTIPSHFLIGSKSEAERVVNQYQELVQNEAKCTVKMIHNSNGGVYLSELSPGKEMEQAESVSGYVQSSLMGKGVKHRPPPIKLPSSSGGSSTGNIFSPQQSSGHLKSPTPPPPPPKPPAVSRKQSLDLNQLSMLSPAAMSPASSSQRSGTPKPSSPTPTNPHPPGAQSSTLITHSVTLTPQDSGFTPQPTLLTPFAQQQMSLSQALPVMTIPLSTMVTSITTGTSSNQVMTNTAGLNFINVVGSVCGAQTLMSGSNSMLGCSTGAVTPAGINLSSILPPGGLVPNALPAAVQPSASQSVMIVDPTAEEEDLATGVITVVTDEEGKLCSVHKPGSALTGAKLQDCISRATARQKEVRKLMDKVIKSVKPT